MLVRDWTGYYSHKEEKIKSIHACDDIEALRMSNDFVKGLSDEMESGMVTLDRLVRVTEVDLG